MKKRATESEAHFEPSLVGLHNESGVAEMRAAADVVGFDVVHAAEGFSVGAAGKDGV